MRFDEGTILGIYPDLFTLAVARNCLAFVRRTFDVRVYIRVFTSEQLRFHGVFAGKFAGAYIQTSGEGALRRRRGSLHEGRVARRAPSIEFVLKSNRTLERRPKN